MRMRNMIFHGLLAGTGTFVQSGNNRASKKQNGFRKGEYRRRLLDVKVLDTVRGGSGRCIEPL